MVKLTVGSHCCHSSLLAVVNFTASSHCSLLAVVNFTASSHCCHCSLLAVKISPSAVTAGHCCSEKSLLATANSEQSLLPTASSEQSLLLLPTVTFACVRACVLKYTCTIGQASFLHVCRFVTFLHKTLFPLEGKSGHSLLLLPTVTAAYPCVCACACMHAYWSIHIPFNWHDFYMHVAL